MIDAIKKADPMFEIPKNQVMQLNAEDHTEYFMHSKHEEGVKEYNSCVEQCQKPTQLLRFELEFQMREWLISMNECFHYCKMDNSSPIDCNIKCLSMHRQFLNSLIAPKVRKVWAEQQPFE